MALQELNQKFSITNQDGTASTYFMQYLRDRGGFLTAQEQQLRVLQETLGTLEVTAGVGLTGGGLISESPIIDLEDTAVIPGSYANTNLTVDAQGRITAASNGSSGGGGGLGCYGTVPGSGGNSSSNFATKGREFTPLYDGSVEGLVFNFSAVSGASYVASLFELSGTTITSIIAQSATWVAPSAGQIYQPFTLSGAFIAGSRYGVSLTRTDSTTTYALPVAQATSGTFLWVGCPFTDFSSLTLASTGPAVSDSINSVTAAFSGDVLMSLSP